MFVQLKGLIRASIPNTQQEANPGFLVIKTTEFSYKIALTRTKISESFIELKRDWQTHTTSILAECGGKKPLLSIPRKEKLSSYLI